MNNLSRSILVILPHSVRLGAAIFSRNELVYFAVKTIPSPRSIESIKEVTSVYTGRLINSSGAEVVVTNKMSKRQERSSRQRAMAKAIAQTSAKHGVKVTVVRLHDVLRAFKIEKYPAKPAVLAKVCRLYPEIAQRSGFQNRSQKEYYLPQLWAVAVGAAHLMNRGSFG